MVLGLGVLKLPPATFWSMTLVELAAALDGLYGRTWREQPLARAEFNALMRRFPDQS